MASTPTPLDRKPASGSRRERGAKVRERVLEVATDLMARRGYSGTTISAISKASGVLPASIYWHFENKEGLLGAVIDRAADAWFEGAAQAADEEQANLETDQMSHAGFRYVFEHAPEFPRVLLLISLERRDEGGPTLEAVKRVRARFQERMIDRFQERLAERCPPERSRKVAERLASLALVLVDGAFVGHQIDAGETMAAEERYAQISWVMGLARQALLAGIDGVES
jgi:AcrR family transcriptional regulator